MTLFRKQATAAYLNVDRRGTILQVTPPALTIAFVALTALFVGGIVFAATGRVRLPLESRGTLHPNAPPVQVRAQRGGRILGLPFDAGRDVKRDQIIARIDDAREKRAAAECRRTLAESKEVDQAASPSLDTATQMRRLRARDLATTLENKCTELERAVEDATVTSPIDGRLELLDVAIGQTVREGDPIAEIRPPQGRIVATIRVPETRASEIEPGAEVRLVFDAFPADRFGAGIGRVQRVGYARAEKEGTNEEAGVVVDIDIEVLPKGAEASAGMTFTSYVETRKVRLLSFLLPSAEP